LTNPGAAPDPFDWAALYPSGLARRWSPPEQPLWRFLADAAEAKPDAIALIDDRDVSFAELWDQARAFGGVATRHGLRERDRVLLVLPNCVEFVAAYHGALTAGCVVTAASPALTVPELTAVIADAEPRMIVHAPEKRDAITAAVEASGVHNVVAVSADHGAFARSDADRIDPGIRAPHDPAVLQYTSGTTGGLKAATMTHGNLVANALQNNLWFGWTRDDVILGALPLCHTWGMGCVMNAALAAGARVALVRNLDAEAILEVIARMKVTIAYGSATLFHRLLDAAGAAAPRRFASLRYVKAGAMLIGGDLSARWAAAVPRVPMINGYGLTEAGPEVTNNPPQAPRAGTVGIPLPGTGLRLGPVPDSDGEDVPQGAGEVQIRGPQVMAAYWRRAEATRAAFTEDGWLRTGDLARFDDAGYLVILDRLKDLIKHRGWSIVPGEVERALREHPAVAEACVVGVPDRRDGEVPVACVVLGDGASAPSGEGWTEHLAPRLARFKHPRRFVVLSEIPKNHVGKPLRRLLRDRLRSG